jgi:DNA polymerase III delta prime subunit
MSFVKATKHEAKLRLALAGPSGSGKTYTALQIATHLGGPIALVDTERGSACKYADLFNFDVLQLDSFHPQQYIDAIHDAENGGYAVLILDSLSHAWTGKDGALELVDKAAKRLAAVYRSGKEDSFAAWREVTPIHNALVDAMVQSRLHLIVTMRTKTEYVVETKDGKTAPRKIGLAPIQRDGLEYEFDVFADLDQDNTLIVQKTRCPTLAGGVFPKAGKDVAAILNTWLKGAPLPPAQAPATPSVPSTPLTVFITAEQLERLIRFQNECLVSDEAFKEHLLNTYKIKSRKLIPAVRFQAVLAWLAKQQEARMEAEERAAMVEEGTL